MADKSDGNKPDIERVYPKNIDLTIRGSNWIRSSKERLMDWRRLPGPNDTVHMREEPDESGNYAGGGIVKSGSATHVTCKDKFGG